MVCWGFLQNSSEALRYHCLAICLHCLLMGQLRCSTNKASSHFIMLPCTSLPKPSCVRISDPAPIFPGPQGFGHTPVPSRLDHIILGINPSLVEAIDLPILPGVFFQIGKVIRRLGVYFRSLAHYLAKTNRVAKIVAPVTHTALSAWLKARTLPCPMAVQFHINPAIRLRTSTR